MSDNKTTHFGYETVSVDEKAGKVTSAVSGKTGYLVVGDDAGESKIAKVKGPIVKLFLIIAFSLF